MGTIKRNVFENVGGRNSNTNGYVDGSMNSIGFHGMGRKGNVSGSVCGLTWWSHLCGCWALLAVLTGPDAVDCCGCWCKLTSGAWGSG